MKTRAIGMVMLMLVTAAGMVLANTRLSNVSLEGEIQGENIIFVLRLDAETASAGEELALVTGDVGYLSAELPRNAELLRRGDGFAVRLPRSGGFFGRGKQSMVFRFAARPVKDGEWRQAAFSIPSASIRRVGVMCDRNDLEVVFPGALNVERTLTEADDDSQKRARVTGFLGLSDQFTVRWKPEVRKLDAELVATCDASTIATASVGALRLDTIYTFRVIQGALAELAFRLPDINITQVHGEDIQDWRIDRENEMLLVTLSRPREELYRLRVESEMVLPAFPCEFTLPAPAPLRVLRTSGFLMIGADSAIRLQVKRAAGLTQIDPGSFPAAAEQMPRSRPSRNVYAYQFANMPYGLEISADDIVTSFTADNRLELSLSDRMLSLRAAIELDVKDAALRELWIDYGTDSAWTVTGVAGREVAVTDTDVREQEGRRLIYVPFRRALLGTALIEIQMERALSSGTESFSAPVLSVRDARAERGYLVVAAEKGLRLKPVEMEGLREVHTGSAPMRISNAQHAFRFREPGWRVDFSVERAASSVHSEVFHLVSLSEGVMYCSAAITYHVSAAPLQDFKLHIPADIERVEFTGADIEGWTRDGELCTVRLQSRIMGDYTLLVTYDRAYSPDNAELAVAGIETVGTESEVGYVVLASSASISVSEARPLPVSMFAIDRDEIPPEYAALVNDPIIGAFKYTHSPHRAMLKVERYPTAALLGQIADYVELFSELSKDGESVTTVNYYIKNATRQHLLVQLPENAHLWSIRYVDEDGEKEDALSQRDGAVILVPVKRLRDPNTALQVEVIYAMNHGAPGFWRSGIGRFTLVGPVLPRTHAAFVRWQVSAPAGFSIAGASGTMSGGNANSGGGLAGAGRKTLQVLRALFSPRRSVIAALKDGWGGGSQVELTRAVELSSGPHPEVNLEIIPAWLGSNSSARGFLGGLLLGTVILADSMRRRRGVFLFALGATVIAAGLAEAALGRTLLTIIFLAALVAAFFLYNGHRLLARCLVETGRILRRSVTAVIKPSRRRRSAERAEDENGLNPFEPLEVPPAPSAGDEGAALPSLLLALTMLTAATGVLTARTVVPEPAVPMMDAVGIVIEGPAAGSSENSAQVQYDLTFKTAAALSFIMTAPESVLKEYELSDELELNVSPRGYMINVQRAGEHRVQLTVQMPVRERDGTRSLRLALPENLRNKVLLRIPETGLDVQSDEAVLFVADEKGKTTEVEAVFGSARQISFIWRPRVRRTQLEQTVFFCEVNALAGLQAGVVDISHQIQCRIAQGELREIRLRVPRGMTVTAVDTPGVATWSFDPDSRFMDAIFERPVTGELTLHVRTQVSCDGLPYDADLGALEVIDAARQRGSLALAAPENIQLRVESTAGLTPMNIEDFSAEAVVLATGRSDAVSAAQAMLRRAYRYHNAADVVIRVNAEPVMPELRVEENGALTIADERIALATRLRLDITKAGVFAVELELPEGFDIETLTGRDVSHWDESGPIAGSAEETVRWNRITVHFNRPVQGATEINLVMARTERGIEPVMRTPRVRVSEARTHRGRLTIAGERGVRLMVENQIGVDMKKASEVGIRQAGVLVFDIHRPDWQIDLRTEALDPVIRPQILQTVELTEGMLQIKAYIRYRIDNAGVNTLLLRSPDPEATLSVSGSGIARVHLIDIEQGIWQVDLHNRVENQYSMLVTCQTRYQRTGQRVDIVPLTTVDTEEARGYLAVTSAGRVEVSAAGEPAGLRIMDARNLPAEFGAGDLSSAVKCYEIFRPDFLLPLSVIRHDSADVLPAGIEQTRITSVMAADGKQLIRVELTMNAGRLRLLKVDLPAGSDNIWLALVNGQEAPVSRDGGLYCIPLDVEEGARDIRVEFMYAGNNLRSGWRGWRRYDAPSFDGLPLRDIEWVIYAPPGMRYSGFKGTMDLQDTGYYAHSFDVHSYLAHNRTRREATLLEANRLLDEGAQLMRAGRQREARDALRNAVNYSQGEADLNEDARVQFRNLQMQQVKVGLYNRRDSLRAAQNIAFDSQHAPLPAVTDGEFSPEHIARFEQELSQREKSALEIVADRIVGQQDAAKAAVSAIRVAMPEHGRPLRFYRRLHIDPAADLTVEFRVVRGDLSAFFNRLWPALLLLAACAALGRSLIRLGD